MDPGGQRSDATSHPQPDRDRPRGFFASRRVLRARDLQLHGFCESATECLIYFTVVFSPWAFGTTQPWSVRTMNVAGYLLGLLLALKLWVRWGKGYRPARWEEVRGPWSVVRSPQSAVRSPQSTVHSPRLNSKPRWTVLLAGLTAAILGYCLISAVNARAVYRPQELSFAYREHFIKWLPHSLDSTSTWAVFWNYLALACSFWAVRDWLLGKSDREQRVAFTEMAGSRFLLRVPDRLRRLLWVMAVNGGMLALEGIAQRVEGRGNLLFMLKPRINRDAESQFGPYAYRANAAAYFNLLWPVCLGFWLMLQRSRAGQRRHHLLLICAGLMAACPIISTSRAGAAVDSGLLIAGTVCLLCFSFWRGPRNPARSGSASGESRLRRRSRSQSRRAGEPGPAGTSSTASLVPGGASTGGSRPAGRRYRPGGNEGMRGNVSLPSRADFPNKKDAMKRVLGGRPTLALLLVFCAGVLGLGYAFGWKNLKPRWSELAKDYDNRDMIYEQARPMAEDYPVFGTGPGTFETVFDLYRVSTETYWPAQVHNDWLETRITFGWAGSLLIALSLATVLMRWFGRGGIYGGRRFVVLTWLALAGCLVHARYDFPFQIYSILFLFLVLCAILSGLTRRV